MRHVPSTVTALAASAALLLALGAALPAAAQDWRSGGQGAGVVPGAQRAGISPYRYGLGEASGGYSAAGSGGSGERAGRYGLQGGMQGMGGNFGAYGPGFGGVPTGQLNTAVPGSGRLSTGGQAGAAAAPAAGGAAAALQGGAAAPATARVPTGALGLPAAGGPNLQGQAGYPASGMVPRSPVPAPVQQPQRANLRVDNRVSNGSAASGPAVNN